MPLQFVFIAWALVVYKFLDRGVNDYGKIVRGVYIPNVESKCNFLYKHEVQLEKNEQ